MLMKVICLIEGPPDLIVMAVGKDGGGDPESYLTWVTQWSVSVLRKG